MCSHKYVHFRTPRLIDLAPTYSKTFTSFSSYRLFWSIMSHGACNHHYSFLFSFSHLFVTPRSNCRRAMLPRGCIGVVPLPYCSRDSASATHNPQMVRIRSYSRGPPHCRSIAPNMTVKGCEPRGNCIDRSQLFLAVAFLDCSPVIREVLAMGPMTCIAPHGYRAHLTLSLAC